ncbi:MAG: glycoside hydrolase family 76 protein [Mycobacteriaceae bacterium]
MRNLWSARANSAEEAVFTRHLRPLFSIPGTSLGVVAWPPVRREKLFVNWHYWWQAHLIDTMVDAAVRSPRLKRRRRIALLIRTHRLRNLGRWTNSYYDDMAWLAIALERACRLVFIDKRKALSSLESQLIDAWVPDLGGGIPWRKHDKFFNAPANGPAAIVLARNGRQWRAQAMVDWIDANLRDPETGLIFDGKRENGELERNKFTYCQGVVLGAETELAIATGEKRHAERVHRLVAAVDRHMSNNGVIRGDGGGDGGLFNGILARYLAVVASSLPGDDPKDEYARTTARNLVLTSAEAAWENRLQVDGLPLFSADWSQPARMPSSHAGFSKYTGGAVVSSEVPERDLSVQISGWMLLEAAYVVAQ